MKNNDIELYINRKGNILDPKEYDKLTDAKKKLYKPEKRQLLVFGKDKQFRALVEPRLDKEDLNYSRELFRSQIAFGSDPLDELGLTGSQKFYDIAYHSLLKLDFLGDT